MAEGRAGALLLALTRPSDIPHKYRVFANRNLRLSRIELVGFDMDYTLALYDQPRMEVLSVKATVDKLIGLCGYPEAIRALSFDARMGMRGLIVDRHTGNIFKPDRYGVPGRGYHGTKPLDETALRELYQRQRTRLSSERYAFIDTLFALPEAVLWVALVDYFDAHPDRAPPYERIWDDIRYCIDLAHSDGAIKDLIAQDLATYIERDPHLPEALHKMRSTGKRLFLLTNSAWEYTDPVMRYLIEGTLPNYPSWRHFFDVIVVSAAKPRFFTEEAPFVLLKASSNGGVVSKVPMPPGPFARGHIYAGGNLREFEERTGVRGDRVLFVGDHIYGDIVRSRRSSAWRTAMVLQELEHELAVCEAKAADLETLEALERKLRNLDAEIEEKQVISRMLQKLTPEEAGPGLEEARTAARELLGKLRADLRGAMSAHRALEQAIDGAFNPYWGSMFKEGREVSKFGGQVEDYACLYTSRVSNFRFYSPMRHFRGPRDRMPHER